MRVNWQLYLAGGIFFGFLMNCSNVLAITPKYSLEQLRQQYRVMLERLPDKLTASIHLQNLEDGSVLFAHNDEDALVPASAMKLVTSAAALEVLGPGFEVETKVFAKGKRQADELKGDLIIQGQGDPFIVGERMWILASAVARSGIKSVSGQIKIDDNYFDDTEGTLIQHGKGEPYAAKLSATSLNFNNLEVHVVPNTVNNRVDVYLGPVNHVYAKLNTNIKLVEGRARNISVESTGYDGNQETFKVSGIIGREAKPAVYYYPVEDPAAYFGQVFLGFLQKEGIKVEGGYGGKVAKSSGTLLAKLNSLPLIDLLRLTNTYSNNFMAEQIFRILGASEFEVPATDAKGVKAIYKFFSKIEECKGPEIAVANGSGFHWNTKISSRCFGGLLRNNYREFRSFADLIGSVPVGATTGTLKARFDKFGTWFDPWKVRAKTGTLWSKGAVTSLVGYTSTRNGVMVGYSLILNHKRRSSAPVLSMRAWEEKFVSELQKLEL